MKTAAEGLSPDGRWVTIDPYAFYTGVGSLNATMALSKLFDDLPVDWGAWGTPFKIHIATLSDEDRTILFEMIDDGYASVRGYGV